MSKVQMTELANGTSVPTACVQALTRFDNEVWPGSTFHVARAAVARVVLEAADLEAKDARIAELEAKVARVSQSLLASCFVDEYGDVVVPVDAVADAIAGASDD